MKSTFELLIYVTFCQIFRSGLITNFSEVVLVSFLDEKKGSDTPESIKQKRTCSWEDSRDTWHRFGNAWYNLSRNSNHVCFPNVLFFYLIFRSKYEGNYEKIWTKLIFCNLKSIKKRWKSGHWGKASEILRK